MIMFYKNFIHFYSLLIIVNLFFIISLITSNYIMRVSTKYFSLPVRIYVKECFLNGIKSQWYISFLLLSGIAAGVWFKMLWLIITASILEVLYLCFWLLQFYAVQYIPQNQIMFKKMYYEFFDDKILMHLDAKMCAQFFWSFVQKVKRRKKYYVLFLSKAQIIYVPKDSFNSQFELNMFDVLLKNMVKK